MLNRPAQSSSPPAIDEVPITCHHISQDTLKVNSDSKDMDNLLKSLRRYYDSVRTKRQLNLNVPAGFRQKSHVQQLFHNFTPPRKARSEDPIISQVTSNLPIQFLSDIVNLLRYLQQMTLWPLISSLLISLWSLFTLLLMHPLVCLYRFSVVSTKCLYLFHPV